MDDFLLRIRFEALKNTLVQLRCIFESVRNRRNDVDQLSQTIDRAWDRLGDVSQNVGSLLRAANEPEETSKVHPDLKKFIFLIDGYKNDLDQALAEAKSKVATIKHRRVPIEKVEERLRESLHEEIDSWLGNIDRNLKALKTRQENDHQLVETAWKEYAEIVSEQERLFSFSEYVDLLGGLALRDAGLDGEICRLADELITSCGLFGTSNWNALTIPANQEAVTLARSIRMGFPEWTLWAVPLTAHELGQLAISNGRKELVRRDSNTRWEKYIFKHIPKKGDSSNEERNRMRIYLADAFATYAMGPAYACSAILLRFDLRMKTTRGKAKKAEYPSQAERGYIILDMLSKMIAKDKFDKPFYEPTVRQVQAAWDMVLARIQPPGSLSSAQRSRLESYNEYMLDDLSGTHPGALYLGDKLESTCRALKGFLDGEKPLPFLEGEGEGRDVLNAAWMCRIEGEYDVREIEIKAQELWDLITAEKRKATEPLVRQETTPAWRRPNLSPAIPGDKVYGRK
ncbi:MAG TPA: hypothetical protein VK582_12185 [Pyrinomonadaceae bacterium]|nr:hypothetical protein [Pyrinomonadaceae bacterium]